MASHVPWGYVVSGKIYLEAKSLLLLMELYYVFGWNGDTLDVYQHDTAS